MTAHYSTAVISARVARPCDKAPVEAGVLLVERWILAALRNRTFFGVRELNQAMESLDKLAMHLLPPTRYEFLEWKTAKAGNTVDKNAIRGN